MTWHSPITGEPLHQDAAHSLSDGDGERWPVVDGIPYLRTGREELVERALAECDAGRPDAALVLLLADQDEWWTGPETESAELQELVARRDEITLRHAMVLLRYGPVGDYFAYRWSDPTFLAGLALLEAHWHAPATAFELAGGIGHYARELGRRGVACTSADIVFSKCWLGKIFVAPGADFVVFDAKDTWPIAERRFDLVHCQDAFYFLPEQARVADRMRAAVAREGTLAVGHLHNSGIAGEAMGPARSGAEWASLFPGSCVYDERELRRALLAGERPTESDWEPDATLEAWSVAESAAEPVAIAGRLAWPRADARLQPNPLIAPGGPRWPSDRYAAEYGTTATWTDPASPAAPERDRRLVELPERW